MMSKNWFKFHTSHSPVVPNRPNTISTRINLQKDWSRALAEDPQSVFIDGRPLSAFGENYKNFSNEAEVTKFFEEVILSKMAGTPEDKLGVIEYLKKAFHQQGLMYPVSNPLQNAMKDKNSQGVEEVYATFGTNSLEKKTNIVTTAHGFKVQEFATLNSIRIEGELRKSTPEYATMRRELKAEIAKLDNKASIYANQVDHLRRLAKRDFDKVVIEVGPKKGKHSVACFQATIDVNLTTVNQTGELDPTISIESNLMRIEHPFLKRKLDKRGLGRIIIDFFRNVLGMHNVKDISSRVDSSMRIDSKDKTHETDLDVDQNQFREVPPYF